MKVLKFNLSKLECIKIIPDGDIDLKRITMCHNMKIYFCNDFKLRIGQQSAGIIFDDFIECLQKAIDGTLQLHESFTQNLGFMENEYSHKYSHEKPGFLMIPSVSGQSTYWVGANYNVWRSYADADPYVYTWLYNDSEGNIIFEVTKFYKWSMKKREPNDFDFVTYKKFMKDYKPLIHRVIPRDVAIAWLKKAKKWYQVIYKNEMDVINS